MHTTIKPISSRNFVRPSSSTNRICRVQSTSGATAHASAAQRRGEKRQARARARERRRARDAAAAIAPAAGASRACPGAARARGAARAATRRNRERAKETRTCRAHRRAFAVAVDLCPSSVGAPAVADARRPRRVRRNARRRRRTVDAHLPPHAAFGQSVSTWHVVCACGAPREQQQAGESSQDGPSNSIARCAHCRKPPLVRGAAYQVGPRAPSSGARENARTPFARWRCVLHSRAVVTR